MNNKQLVAAGHAFAAAINDDTPLITMAKIITELATALDVQTAVNAQLRKQITDNRSLQGGGNG